MEFVLVAVLLVALIGGLVQVSLALHVRNTLISCAAEGARLASRDDQSVEEGIRRTEELARAALGDYAVNVTAEEVVVDGAPVVVVRVSTPVPIVGLWGVGTMSVEAQAIKEVDRG